MADTAVTVTEPTAPTVAQTFSAEVLGTFVLVFFGVGTALATGADVITTGLAFGLTVLVMAYSVGRISGGHFNPAVTVGAAVSGRLAWSQTPLYIGAQLLGAIGGGVWCCGASTRASPASAPRVASARTPSATSRPPDWRGGRRCSSEIVTTLVFLMVILAVTDERNEHPALAPLAIGLSLAMIHFTTIPLTGTSVNPARSIGPALFAGGDAIAQQWLFIVAPLVGGGVAGLLYPLLFGRHGEPVAGSGLRFGRRTPPGAVPGYGAPDAYQQQWNQQYGARSPVSSPASPSGRRSRRTGSSSRSTPRASRRSSLRPPQQPPQQPAAAGQPSAASGTTARPRSAPDQASLRRLPARRHVASSTRRRAAGPTTAGSRSASTR